MEETKEQALRLPAIASSPFAGNLTLSGWSAHEKGFPRDTVEKNPPAVQETQELTVPSLGQEDPLEEGMGTHSSILARELHGQRSLVGYSP